MKNLAALAAICALSGAAEAQSLSSLSRSFSNLSGRVRPLSETLAADSEAGISPQREAAIKALMPRWRDVKADGYRMMDYYLAQTAQDADLKDYPALKKHIEEMWGLCNSIETNQAALERRLIARMEFDSSISADAFGRRAAAAAQVTQVRMLWIYGNLLPGVLDESIVSDDGKNVGREYAGPDWTIWISKGEMMAIEHELYPQTGFSKQDWNSSAPGRPQKTHP